MSKQNKVNCTLNSFDIYFSVSSKETKPVGEQCSGTCRYASPTNQCGDGCFCSAKWAGYGACESLRK